MQLWTRVWDKSFPYSSSISFFNYFCHVINRMLDHTLFRPPNELKYILRPQHARDNVKLDHDLGSIFSFPECNIFRVFACPQPPHILPKYLSPRLAIIEFFWQCFLMNREYFPPNLHKGTFLCRSFKVGDFVNGKNSLDQLSDYLREYNLASIAYTMYDPTYYIRDELKALRGYTLPTSKELPLEDLIMNVMIQSEVEELIRKYEDIARVGATLMRYDPNFKGFCLNTPYQKD